jgi:hypothetical protein
MKHPAITVICSVERAPTFRNQELALDHGDLVR